MGAVLWICQLILAGVFLFTGFSKILVYDKVTKFVEARNKTQPIGIAARQAAIIGVAEIAGALGEIIPIHFAFYPYFLPLVASAFLAILMMGAFKYHLKRKESPAPSVVLILLAAFVIVGRWPWWG
jgi:predicted histidine transporter YuiF (NhaC family)